MAVRSGGGKEGVSVITCTNKPAFMNNIFANYKNQTFHKKELIIVLNNNAMNIQNWRKKANAYQHVSIYQLPQSTSLGHCLNFAVKYSKYEYIAKFDDDDFYAPKYLSDSIRLFKTTKADIIGKRSYFTYFEHKHMLMIRFPNQENRFVPLVHGGTFIVKREVFKRVKFADRSIGEDVRFLLDCARKGFRIYSGSRYHYAYIRRPYGKHHTWKVSDNYILKACKFYSYTDNYKTMVQS